MHNVATSALSPKLISIVMLMYTARRLSASNVIRGCFVMKHISLRLDIRFEIKRNNVFAGLVFRDRLLCANRVILHEHAFICIVINVKLGLNGQGSGYIIC